MLAGFLAFAAIAAVPEVTVDVGHGEWNQFPALRMVERRMPTAEMVERVEGILAERRCRIAGQTAERFDFDVPYAVLLAPDGTPHRVIVEDIACPPIEAFVGAIVLERAAAGDFPPTGDRGPRWYASRMNFNLQ